MRSGSLLAAGSLPQPFTLTILVIFGLCAGCTLCELSCRLLHPWMPEYVSYDIPPRIRLWESWHKRRDRTGQLAGGRFSIDGSGFRNGGSNGPHDRTVLFIGDSFTFGYGVDDEDTLVAAAQRELLRNGLHARCLNAGVSRFGTAHELRLLRRLLAEYPVDAVIFQVYPENDLEDNWEDGRFDLQAGKLTVHKPPRIPVQVRVRGWLYSLSESLNSVALKTLCLSLYRHWLSPTIDDGQFELEGALLREVVRTVEVRNVPLLIFVVPPPPFQGSLGPGSNYRRILELVKASGAHWVDVERTVERPEHYLPGHGHFSVAGNAFVGNALADSLAPLLQRPAGAPG